jgi:hypothetical protein
MSELPFFGSERVYTDDEVASRCGVTIKPSLKMAFNEAEIYSRIGTDEWVLVSDDKEVEPYDDDAA